MAAPLDYLVLLTRARAGLSIGLEYPLAEVAAALGVSVTQVLRWQHVHGGPAVAVRTVPGTRIRRGFVQGHDLLRFLRERATRQVRIAGDRGTAA